MWLYHHHGRKLEYEDLSDGANHGPSIFMRWVIFTTNETSVILLLRTDLANDFPTYSKECGFCWRERRNGEPYTIFMYTRAFDCHVTHSPCNPLQRENLHLPCSQQLLQASSSRAEASPDSLLLICEVVLLNLGELSALGTTGSSRSRHTESRAIDKFVRRPR